MTMKTESVPNQVMKRPYMRPAGPPLKPRISEISLPTKNEDHVHTSEIQVEMHYSVISEVLIVVTVLTYTSMPSQVHINPHENPVIEASPNLLCVS